MKHVSRDTENTDISGVLVTLHIGDEQKLFLMLTNDGMVKRLGDGSEDCRDRDLYIGKTSLNAFENARDRSGNILKAWIGRYAAPESIGKSCRLVVGFQLKDGSEMMSEWEYGSESQGPPPEIASLVVQSVQDTAPWYMTQKAAKKSI